MESLFENEFTVGKKEQGEYQLHRLTHSGSLIAFIAYSLFVIAVFLFFKIKFGVSHYFFLLFIPAFAIMKAVSGLLAVKRNLRALNEQCGGKPCVLKFAFYEDHGEAQNLASGGASHIGYPDIRKLEKTKNLIMLITKANMAFVMRRDTFTKGTEEEFCRFIEDKIFENKSKA